MINNDKISLVSVNLLNLVINLRNEIKKDDTIDKLHELSNTSEIISILDRLINKISVFDQSFMIVVNNFMQLKSLYTDFVGELQAHHYHHMKYVNYATQENIYKVSIENNLYNEENLLYDLKFFEEIKFTPVRDQTEYTPSKIMKRIKEKEPYTIDIVNNFFGNMFNTVIGNIDRAKIAIRDLRYNLLDEASVLNKLFISGVITPEVREGIDSIVRSLNEVLLAINSAYNTTELFFEVQNLCCSNYNIYDKVCSLIDDSTTSLPSEDTSCELL